MSYVAMVNGFSQHPKIMDLHDRAFRFHVAGLDYCSTNLTDGHLSDRGVKVVAAVVNTQPKRWVAELVGAKLWKPDSAGDGFWINDYLVHNPPAESMRELSDKRRQAGIRGAEKRWRNDDKSSGKSHSKSHSKELMPAVAVEVSEVLTMDSGRHFDLDGLPETINPENLLLVVKLMKRIGDHADRGTRHIVEMCAAQLPPAALNKVIESLELGRPVDRAAYAVGALRSEIEERAA